VKELRQQGTTILLTTHYMHEAEVLCDRLVILNEGVIVAEGTPRAMIHTHTPGYVGIYSTEDRPKVEKALVAQSHLLLTEDSSALYLRTPEIHQFTIFRQEYGLEPLQIRPANLEDVFLKLTGREIEENA
jgi:lipooligosaccharide transport system ATP-binding protein